MIRSKVGWSILSVILVCTLTLLASVLDWAALSVGSLDEGEQGAMLIDAWQGRVAARAGDDATARAGEALALSRHHGTRTIECLAIQQVELVAPRDGDSITCLDLLEQSLSPRR